MSPAVMFLPLTVARTRARSAGVAGGVTSLTSTFTSAAARKESANFFDCSSCRWLRMKATTWSLTCANSTAAPACCSI
ncbi:MAG: hypothetical protein DMF66_18490, partial [Acidobacteria bacterium]